MEGRGISRGNLLVLAGVAGAAAANLYYNQPLLEQLGRELGASAARVSLVPTLTQLGYAAGMLLVVPLGDMLRAKRLVLVLSVLVTAALVGAAVAPSLEVLAVMSFVIGFTTVVPQVILPVAARLARPREAGAAIGTIMSGLLIGILLARTLSGAVASLHGWRMMFHVAAGLMVLQGILLARVLPDLTPLFPHGYFALMRSIFDLVRRLPTLREASLVGAMLFGAFSVFWSTLAFHLAAYGYGPSIVGLFGLVGAIGALAAPFVGKFADRGDARRMIGLGLVLAIASFVELALFGHGLVGLTLGVIVMDFAVQAGHISNQTRVYALDPQARSRLNTVYMFSYFMGGSLGSILGAFGWRLAGWTGVCGAALAMLFVGLAAFIWGNRTPRASVSP